jgi:hypothetical protein
MSVETKPPQSSMTTQTGRSSMLVVMGLVLVLVLAVLAYSRLSHRSSEQTLSGQARVGMNEASVTVGGWTYGFATTTMPWYDTAGGVHEGDVAAPCLRNVGTQTRITFGEVPVIGPSGDSWRDVVWVRCG